MHRVVAMKGNNGRVSEVVENSAQQQAQIEATWQANSAKADKAAAIGRITDHFLALVDGSFPGANTLDDLEQLAWIWNSVNPTARSPELITAAQQRSYAKARIQDVKDGTLPATYEPATDANWPA